VPCIAACRPRSGRRSVCHVLEPRFHRCARSNAVKAPGEVGDACFRPYAIDRADKSTRGELASETFEELEGDEVEIGVCGLDRTVIVGRSGRTVGIERVGVVAAVVDRVEEFEVVLEDEDSEPLREIASEPTSFLAAEIWH
jgi:hypothetical protein